MSNFSKNQAAQSSQMKIAEMDVNMRKVESDKKFRSQCVQWALTVTQPKQSPIVDAANPSGKQLPPTPEDILANAAKFEAFLSAGE